MWGGLRGHSIAASIEAKVKGEECISQPRLPARVSARPDPSSLSFTTFLWMSTHFQKWQTSSSSQPDT